MIKDRLEELKGFLSDDEEDLCIGIEERNRYIQDFVDEVLLIRENIDTIYKNVSLMEEMHSVVLSSPKSDPKLKKQLKELEAEVKRTSNRVRAKLKRMERDVEELEQTSGLNADFRIRNTQYSMLSHMFVKAMRDYNQLLCGHRERCKARIKRSFSITGIKISEDQAEKMFENDEVPIFTQEIITDTQIAKEMLTQIEDRREDIIRLENTIQELHNMFIDLASMAGYQGQLLDTIEYHVHQARDNITEAVKETIGARKAKEKARRKRFLMLICLIIFVTLLFWVWGGLLAL